MSKTDVLDQQAIASARQYMGVVAWPTIVLGLVLGASYFATVIMALTGDLSLWLAVPMVAVLTYLNYTILHESVHGSISGNRQSLRWLNKAMGYMAAWILMIPLTAHRYEHIAHHRHTNDEATDPDFHIGQMRGSLPAAVRYVDTSIILLPRVLHTPLTWLWMFQNYHSIHHLFPRMPFYKYATLYEEIEDVMMAKGAPIYRVTVRGLEPSSPTLATQFRNE